MPEHQPEQCEAMDCNLPGIYTEPDLNGEMYCLHHCRRAMDVVQKVQIKDLEAERDHWIALAQKRGREIDELVAEVGIFTSRIEILQTQEQQAGNLLAVMHRDGGHYISKYGWKRACKDAEQVRHNLMRRIDELESGIRKGIKKLTDSLGTTA